MSHVEIQMPLAQSIFTAKRRVAGAQFLAGVLMLLSIASRDFAMAADSIEAKVQICASCHGTNGKPSNSGDPVIWGQQAGYIEKQLRDFKSGDRDSQIMDSIAESLNNDDIAPVAALFANKGWPARDEATPAARDAVPATAAACAACHGEKFLGGAAAAAGGEVAPRLADQSHDYLVDAMSAFSSGERTNSTLMTALLNGQTDADREAVAQYLSKL